jgi:hypothetical protein
MNTTTIYPVNANFHPVVKTDGDTDVIIFDNEVEAKSFTDLHPEYSYSGASGIYKTAEEAASIWGD